MLEKIRIANAKFRTSSEVRIEIQNSCKENAELARYVEMGRSEGGRLIYGVILGNGKKTVSLLAGAHSDEPVGPETLRYFITETLKNKEDFAELFHEFRFLIVPHINPDGEAENQTWIKQWPNVSAYFQHVFRELPGRDVEFGYPTMRIENIAVSELIKRYAPISLHFSLHGMGFSDGLMLLIEKHWIDNTEKLRQRFAEYSRGLGFGLHDHDRNGEKGFQYIGAGFTSTPEGSAMRKYFNELEDKLTAKLFHDSSMEFVRKLGGDPLSIVTELPLFLIEKEVEQPEPGLPKAYLAFKEKHQGIREKLLQGEPIDNILREFKVRPLELDLLIQIQLFVIQLGLETVRGMK